MKTSPEEFRRYYQSLSDEALCAMNRDELVESARECYDQERSARGLSVEEPATPAPPAEAPGEQFAVVETFTSMHEAGLAMSLLQAAGIPGSLQDENMRGAGSMFSGDTASLRLVVPAEFLEDACLVLGSDISGADLIAQAEAASMEEEAETPDETSAGPA